MAVSWTRRASDASSTPCHFPRQGGRLFVTPHCISPPQSGRPGRQPCSIPRTRSVGAGCGFIAFGMAGKSRSHSVEPSLCAASAVAWVPSPTAWAQVALATVFRLDAVAEKSRRCGVVALRRGRQCWWLRSHTPHCGRSWPRPWCCSPERGAVSCSIGKHALGMRGRSRGFGAFSHGARAGSTGRGVAVGRMAVVARSVASVSQCRSKGARGSHVAPLRHLSRSLACAFCPSPK